MLDFLYKVFYLLKIGGRYDYKRFYIYKLIAMECSNQPP